MWCPLRSQVRSKKKTGSCEALEAGMKIQFDREEDVLRILLSENPVAESDEDKPGVILDYDKDGYLVGVGILDASKRMGSPMLVE
jgi:uncharacterized protein YuzE